MVHFYNINIDAGFQGQGGKNALVIGNLANPLVNPENPTFEPKVLMNPFPLEQEQIQKDAYGYL